MIPDLPDLERMRRERSAKLHDHMAQQGVDALVLLSTSSVAYAAGLSSPSLDNARSNLFRSVAVVVAGEALPHVFTSDPDSAPPELPGDRVHPALPTDLPGGVAQLRSALLDVVPGGSRVGVDELTYPLAEALEAMTVVSAAGVLGAAKICKTADELSCIRMAQHLNELAMLDAQRVLRPGVRQCELSAAFLRRLCELGAASNSIDPIWQVMTKTRAEGWWTMHGDVAFPDSSTDAFLRHGDVVWVDAGVSYEGYASDFGRTWIVGDDPTPTARQQRQFERWLSVVDAVRDICKPGITALELDRVAIAANGGVKPWLPHFYLAHGVGTDSAEMPFIGTDLGEAFDEALVLQPGMVLVLEPVIWDDGAAGYRSEEIMAITDDGWEPLSAYPYEPYEAAS